MENTVAMLRVLRADIHSAPDDHLLGGRLYLSSVEVRRESSFSSELVSAASTYLSLSSVVLPYRLHVDGLDPRSVLWLL